MIFQVLLNFVRFLQFCPNVISLARFSFRIFVVLKESVRRRLHYIAFFTYELCFIFKKICFTLNASCLYYWHEQGEKEVVPVAVLFSGGLDSVILAALLDQCLYPKCKLFLFSLLLSSAFNSETN